MAIELTPDVSPESAGFGFQVPVFRMNQGVNAATANPLVRGAMQQPMDMVSESQFGLKPDVMAMADEASRQQFYAGVDELNQFVNRAAEFGIDPSKVDMTSPESFALNQEFRKRVQGLQQQARDISTGAAQQALVEREQQRELLNLQREEALLRADYQRGERYLSPFSNLEKSFYQASFNQDPSQRKSVAALGNKLVGFYRSAMDNIRKATNIDEETKAALIENVEGRVVAVQQLIENPIVNQPQVVDPEKAPAGLDYLMGLAQRGQLEEGVKISPAYSRVKRFGETNVISKGAFGLGDKSDKGAVNVIGFEDGFVYLSENKELVPVRKSEVGLYPKNIRLMPATLAIGRTKISEPVNKETVGQKKPVDKSGEAEVSFALSDQELEIMISKGYSSNEAGMMVKQFLSGGGQPSTKAGGKRADRADLDKTLLNP
jgi:hypothetical protein